MKATTENKNMMELDDQVLDQVNGGNWLTDLAKECEDSFAWLKRKIFGE